MKNHLWIIEAKFVQGADLWNPVIGFSDGTPPVWLTRETARLAAKHMQKTNGVNDKFLVSNIERSNTKEKRNDNIN